jgi:E3 ubiquitin-protein ligase MYCBP2
LEAPHCPQVHNEIVESKKIEDDVIKKALERAKHEGLDKEARLNIPGDPYYQNLQKWAMYKCAYYQCFKCKTAYFGGMKDCIQAQQEGQVYKPEELVCSKCSADALGAHAGITNCKKHGTDYIEFKCKFCCSIAQWFCWGNTHFCEPCHKR